MISINDECNDDCSRLVAHNDLQSDSWCVYIIRTEKNTLYTGISNNFQRRWRDHRNANKGAKFFRISAPAKVEYLEAAPNRSAASRREAEIKRLTRPQKEQLILGQTKN